MSDTKQENQTTVYRENRRGHLVPVENISDQDLLKDALVTGIAREAMGLDGVLKSFVDRTIKDVDAFYELVAEKYGVTERGKGKGGRTLTSYDGRYKVQISVQDRIDFSEEIHVAKDLIDSYLRRLLKDAAAPPEITLLVENAFQVDKKGNFNTRRILDLLQYDIRDEEWLRAMEAIKDSIEVRETARQVRVYERNEDGSYRMIPLAATR